MKRADLNKGIIKNWMEQTRVCAKMLKKLQISYTGIVPQAF